MGNLNSSMQNVNYEDIQQILENTEAYMIINTLEDNNQTCLIKNTMTTEMEIKMINQLIKLCNKNIKIIIYGKNYNDDTIYRKFEQLKKLGFYKVFIYKGGIFEWLLLQDVYGDKVFPTNNKILDILKYKPSGTLHTKMLGYS